MTNFNFAVTAGPFPKFEPGIAVNLLLPSIMIAVAVDTSVGGVPNTGVYRSLDGGANWTTTILPLPPGFTGAEAPMVAYGFPNTFVVTAHVFPGASDGTTVIYTSTDNGATFSPPVIVNSGYGTYINNDETNVLIDVGQSSPYLGNIYVTYNHQFNVANGGNSTAFLSRSQDGGATWNNVLLSSVTDQVERPDTAVDLVGNVYAAWITNNTPSRFFIRLSRDGGTTFESAVLVSSVVPVPIVLPVPNYAFRVLTFANVSTDRSSGPFSGRAYAVWQDFRQGYSDILMSFSDNTGTTWSAPVSITGAPAGSQNFFPAIDVDPLLGVVNVIYYSNQVNGFLLDVFVARSINGGQTFTNTRITNSSFNPNGSSPTPVPLIGDYIDIASVPPGGYIGAWADTSTGSLNIVAGYSDIVIT
ncbi:exo-alpha-sialidase [Paenibacillus sp. PK3_47]|uniref:sialidase family protein n=1 Tax=Paenibacillus sp. PK3_47 TaxID=2072642 RepID=UPI00201E147C|nr:sialidase family protein [Paenibacillus sp. PK3_47]UQZ36847.1 exo-alpha-sialidase [Paenibacillus sp. PK3_47]